MHATVGRPLTLVNAGGTGSLEIDSSDPAVTELTAGSGLFSPGLFDGYDAFTSHPSAWFALPVVRRPHRRIATAFGGGYIASGAAGPSRLPRPTWPAGLRLLGAEGAGEVQTPLRGKAARDLMPGDRVWLRHAKAGELAERFASGAPGQRRPGRSRRCRPTAARARPSASVRQTRTQARSSVSPARARSTIRWAPPRKPRVTSRSAWPSIRSMPIDRSLDRVSMTPSV